MFVVFVGGSDYTDVCSWGFIFCEVVKVRMVRIGLGRRKVIERIGGSDLVLFFYGGGVGCLGRKYFVVVIFSFFGRVLVLF